MRILTPFASVRTAYVRAVEVPLIVLTGYPYETIVVLIIRLNLRIIAPPRVLERHIIIVDIDYSVFVPEILAITSIIPPN